MCLCWRCVLFLEAFANARPYLFHLTHRDNLPHIRDLACLFPASVLMRKSDHTELIRNVRRGSRQLVVDRRTIIIRDQDRLHKGNMRVPNGFTFEDLVEVLNDRVFFWPGNANGPISYGLRHFERYQDENPIIIRVPTESLFAANSETPPRFCRYNSGSPRCSNGIRSPRGPDTFLSADEFDGTPSTVVEVTFDTEIILPVGTHFGTHPSGPWRKLT
jgi:hypothetical protein